MDKKTFAMLRECFSDLTSEEYDAYLEVETKATAALIERCDLELAELATEYKTFINVCGTYYAYTVPVLAIATFKKLRPAASQKEKKEMYFAAWLADWVDATFLAICDICDGKEKRSGQASLLAQLGSANTMCLYMKVMNIAYDLTTETFPEEPFLLQLLKICRHHVNEMALSQLIDSSCGKYEKRREPKWYQAREYTSSTAPVVVFPLEVAFCIAQESMDSEFAKASLKLGHVIAGFLRNIDDVLDLESDTLAGRLNWAFWPAWARANDEQREIMLEWCKKDSNQESAAKLVKLYSELNINEEFEVYACAAKENLEKLLDQSPAEISRNTWTGFFDFFRKLYTGVAGPINYHDQ